MERATARQLVGLALLGVVALTAAVALSPAAVARRVSALASEPWLFGAVLLAAYLLRPVVAWPISVLSVVVGYAVGPAGVPVALAGAVVTCVPPYLVARHVGHDAGLLGTLGDHGRGYFAAAGDVRGIVAARLAPLPADPVSYTAGLAGVRPGHYALGTAAGELPWVTAAVLVGASADTVTTEGLHGGPAVIVGATALAVLLLSGPAYQLARERGVVRGFRT
ncbi:TVP38/TMEM64 family protein [Halorarius halobius]|uniref:TVP38/TMEM64 family protein n=1 Tax=Halorarius halobius TaxID=2962671 RepID=UPI0020CD9071|nr:VTT domain-containing protein [Halorarius halobius]